MTTYDAARDYSGEDPQVQVSIVSRTDAYVPELRGYRGLKTFKDMADTDDTVGSMLWAIETTLGQLTWVCKAAENGKPSSSTAALEAAQFANSMLSDMAAAFSKYTETASSMMWAGFSAAEILWKRRLGATPDQNGFTSEYADGLWGVADVVERPAISVTGFVRQNGLIVGLKALSTGGEVQIPYPKVLHHTIRGSSANPWGRSLLTNAYRSWMLKRDLQDSEAIGIRRELCGLPIARVPKSDMDLAQAAQAKRKAGQAPSDAEQGAAARVDAIISAVSRMRFNENAGMLMPSDPWLDQDGKSTNIPQYEFKMLTSSGQRSIDTRNAIRDYDRSIARTAMMQFLHLGDRSGGSHALSDSQSTLALRSIKALSDEFASEWRRKAMTAAFILNQMDLRWLPLMESSPISEDSLAVIGPFLTAMAQAQDLLDANPDLRTAMFSRVGAVPQSTDVIEAPEPSNPSPFQG